MSECARARASYSRRGAAFSGGDLPRLRGELAERTPVLVREHLDELWPIFVPAFKYALCLGTAGVAHMVRDQLFHDALVGDATVPQVARKLGLLLGLGEQGFQRNHGSIAAPREFAVHVEHVADASRHAGAEVAPGLTQHHHGTARHVFAAMVADTLDHRQCARIAYGEALAGYAPEVRLPADRAVEHDVAGDDVFGRLAAELGRRLHRNAPAGQALAAVVVGVPDVIERYALGEESAEALPGGTCEADMDGVVRQPGMAVTLSNMPRQHRPDRAIDVAHRRLDRDLLAALERWPGQLDQAVVERLVQAVILLFAVIARDFGGHLRSLEDLREIEALRLPVLEALLHVEKFRAPDEIVDPADAELSHQLTRFLGDEEEIIDHVLGLALELLAQRRVLGGHAHRAGVQVALPHHDAALDDEWRGCESELVGAEQRTDDHIAPGLHLSVDLHGNAPAQAVQNQRLLGFREPEFPGGAGVHDRRPR